MVNRLTYHLYERSLWRQIKDGPMPSHIGVILDGNRRWASERSFPPWLGHKVGAEKVSEFLEWCWQLGIKTATLYAFSTENFHRRKDEVEAIMRFAEEKFQQLLHDERIYRYRVRVKAMGRLQMLPKRIRELVARIEEATKDHDGFYLNVAIAYGGRAEIVDAVRRIAREVEIGNISPDSIDEKTIEDHLYTSHLPKPDPDLIIRTSGEERLSNFLLWQSAYSEFLFLDVYWPDFRRIDLWRAIRTYQNRKRRFGR